MSVEQIRTPDTLVPVKGLLGDIEVVLDVGVTPADEYRGREDSNLWKKKRSTRTREHDLNDEIGERGFIPYIFFKGACRIGYMRPAPIFDDVPCARLQFRKQEVEGGPCLFKHVGSVVHNQIEWLAPYLFGINFFEFGGVGLVNPETSADSIGMDACIEIVPKAAPGFVHEIDCNKLFG